MVIVQVGLLAVEAHAEEGNRDVRHDQQADENDEEAEAIFTADANHCDREGDKEEGHLAEARPHGSLI